MPRKNVPHRVDEIADAILERMKKSKKKLSKERMYDIAYGTAWKTYYKENPAAKKKRMMKKSEEILENLKLAQSFDDRFMFNIADTIDDLNLKKKAIVETPDKLDISNPPSWFHIEDPVAKELEEEVYLLWRLMLEKNVLDSFDGLPIFEAHLKDKLEAITDDYSIEFSIEFITLQQSFDLARKLKKNSVIILPRNEIIKV
jgi:hypothetical protein